MKTSTDRILTTHTGSLPRPADLTDRHDQQAVRAAVAETVRRQLGAGVDIVNDGEVSKPSYSTYVTERLSGFGGEPVPFQIRDLEAFPEFAQRMISDPDLAVVFGNPSCNGPVAYLDTSLVEADIANLRAAVDGATEVFMSAASPGVIDMFMPNRYYPSTEEYLFALADAMKIE
jgi:5-methyltetrahydropteroyltriglutamate--homocysteine methyltransferase